MFKREFWKAAGERLVRAGAAAAVALYGADATDVIHGADLMAGGQAFASGALLSLLLSLAGGKFGAGNGPSFTGAETTADGAR